MPSISEFVAESRNELKKVNWPSRRDTFQFTVFVIALSVISACVIGALDFIFARALSLIF